MEIKRARAILGKEVEGLTNDQIQEIITSTEILADIAIDTFEKLSPKERKKWLKKPEKQNANR